MLFSALSESEVNKITALLDSEKIIYKTIYDKSILAQNDHFLKSNIKYIHAGNIKTTILALDIEDEQFDRMSLKLKGSLIEYGISIELPEEFEGVSFGEVDHSDIKQSTKGMYSRANLYGALLILAAVLFAKYFL